MKLWSRWQSAHSRITDAPCSIIPLIRRTWYPPTIREVGGRFPVGCRRREIPAGRGSVRPPFASPSRLSAEMTGAVAQMTIEDFVESFVPEAAVLAAARARSEEVGIVPVTPAAGATLRLLAAAAQAKSVVEVGTGTGLSGLWLLRGMRPDGVLTSIDAEAEHQRLARASFSAEGVPNSRARLINGRALHVLPRLADGAYDIVFCSADRREYPDYLTQVVRLLRPHGILIFDGASRGADATARDAESAAIRRLYEQVAEDGRLAPALLPVGTGLLAAAVLPQEAGAWRT